MLLAILAAAGCQRGTTLSMTGGTQGAHPATWRSMPGRAEAVSLLGEPLVAPELSRDVRRQRQADLAEAEAAYIFNTHDIQHIVWLGRRQAYLGRYRDAIATFSRGLEVHPDSPHLLRHRGHRFITLRKFDDALADLNRAAALIVGTADEIEPDGMPNALDDPRSTLHTNIHYHRALAAYLMGDFGLAASAWQECYDASTNDDMRVAAAYWLYLALRRLDRGQDAASVLSRISPVMDVIENHSYHRLLLVFKGDTQPDELLAGADDALGIDDATIGYGVAMQHWLDGERDLAAELFQRIVNSTNWAAFGHIAAEAELARERGAW